MSANIATQRANGSDIDAQSLPGHAVVSRCCWPALLSACSGEVIWMRRILDKYHEAAKEKDVRIVHCCGFDSIPSDLGTCLVVDHLNSLGKYVMHTCTCTCLHSVPECHTVVPVCMHCSLCMLSYAPRGLQQHPASMPACVCNVPRGFDSMRHHNT